MTVTANQNDIEVKSIILKSDSGKSVDIYDQMVYTSLFEDIFSNGMSGYIKLRDAYNLPETFPIIGEETITFDFTSYSRKKTKDTVFTKTFKIHNIEAYELEGSHEYVTYLLHFVSVPFFVNQTKRLNRSFGSETKPMRATNIVKNVCEKMLGIPLAQLTTDQTRWERNLVCTNWTPFQLFNHLAETDILDVNEAATDKESTFLFFEDRDGFKFVSWATLIEDRLVTSKEIKQLFFGKSVNNNESVKRSTGVQQVLRWAIVKMNPLLDNTTKGMFSNRYYYHDIINKTLESVNFDYQQEFPNMSHLETASNSYPLMNQRTIEKKEASFFLPKEYHYANDSKTVRPWRQISRARQAMFENYSIEAEVTGNTGHRLGNVVDAKELPTPKKKGNGDGGKFEQLSGKYLVTKIRHMISSEGYRQVLELRKGVQKKLVGV